MQSQPNAIPWTAGGELPEVVGAWHIAAPGARLPAWAFPRRRKRVVWPSALQAFGAGENGHGNASEFSGVDRRRGIDASAHGRREGAGDQGHHRQGDRRRWLPRAHLCGARSGLLQSRRPRREPGRARSALPGHWRHLRKSHLRADPIWRRTSGAERRQDQVHRRRVAEIAVDHHRAAGHHQAGGPEGQGARLRPPGRRRLRRSAGGATPLLQNGCRQGLQGHLVSGRARAHRRHDQQ